MAGRVLVRFLKAAQDVQVQEQVLTLKTEIIFIQYASTQILLTPSSFLLQDDAV